jgi:hypothetical protein
MLYATSCKAVVPARHADQIHLIIAGCDGMPCAEEFSDSTKGLTGIKYFRDGIIRSGTHLMSVSAIRTEVLSSFGRLKSRE